jgi:hypothetical protein
MCDICRLVTDDTDGGVFITTLTPCLMGLEIAAAHDVSIKRLNLLLTPEETQWVSLVSQADDDAAS